MATTPFRYVVHFGLVEPGFPQEGSTLDFGTDILRAGTFAAELAADKAPNLTVHLVKEVGFANRDTVEQITLFLADAA